MIIKKQTEQEVISELSAVVASSAAEAIERSGVFRVGLSGGSLIKYLATGLLDINTDWSKWQLFFCDERFVPETDIDSTFGAYKKDLIPKTPLKEEQFCRINMDVTLEECAKQYEEKILQAFGFNSGDGIPSFDLLLLGMGPDGHTCSLFPGHRLLNEKKLLIAHINDSPKPPTSRITMTYPLINNARSCVFAMSGTGKAEMIKRIHGNLEPLPAGLVKPQDGTVTWILDNDALSDL